MDYQEPQDISTDLFVATGIPMLIRRVQLLCDLDELTARRVVCAMVRKWELK
jgi:hypothetical protein